MAIRKNKRGMYELSCDVCGFEEPETFDDFYEAVDFKKRSPNWKSCKDNDGEWEDHCYDCQQATKPLDSCRASAADDEFPF